MLFLLFPQHVKPAHILDRRPWDLDPLSPQNPTPQARQSALQQLENLLWGHVPKVGALTNAHKSLSKPLVAFLRLGIQFALAMVRLDVSGAEFKVVSAGKPAFSSKNS